MPNREVVKITSFTDGSEAVMVRCDLTMSELMYEKPSGRWDPEYWHPSFQALFQEMSEHHKLRMIGDFLSFITYGQVGERVYNSKGKVIYIQTKNMKVTGVDYSEKYARIAEGSHNDPERSRLKYGDVLFGNAGMGGLGKVNVFLDNEKVNISQDIDILRFDGLNPFYVAVYLMTFFGNQQVWFRSKGIGAPKLAFDEIRAIRIPLIEDSVQRNIEHKFLEMHKVHDLAMIAKNSGDMNTYSKNIIKAESIILDLIQRTEAVIRGERDDVV